MAATPPSNRPTSDEVRALAGVFGFVAVVLVVVGALAGIVAGALGYVDASATSFLAFVGGATVLAALVCGIITSGRGRG